MKAGELLTRGRSLAASMHSIDEDPRLAWSARKGVRDSQVEILVCVSDRALAEPRYFAVQIFTARDLIVHDGEWILYQLRNLRKQALRGFENHYGKAS